MRSRFVSEDPLGYKGGLNVYRYGADNPLRFVDPKGLTKIDVDIRARKMTVDPEVPGRPPYSVPVTSGHGECMNSPPCGNRPWDGPIPGGGYTIDTLRCRIRGPWATSSATFSAIGAIGGSRSCRIRERTRSDAAALPAAFLYVMARSVDELCGFQALYHNSPSLLSSQFASGTVLGALVFISPIFLNAVGRSRA